MFNLFIPCRDTRPLGEPYDFSLLDDLADMDRLDVMSKTYAVEEKELRPVNMHAEPLARVPFQMTPANAEKGCKLPLFIGDSFADPGMLRNATLRLEMNEIAFLADRVAVEVNGHELAPGAEASTSPNSNSREGTYLFDAGRLLRSGENEITLFLRHRVANVMTNITVTKVELELEYGD